jgi:putative endonuclease
MVRCSDGTLYTGYTNNVPRRIVAHNAGEGGHYTRAHRPVVLIATWTFTTKSEALRVEARIKRLSRAQKLRLVEGISEGDINSLVIDNDGVAHEG